MIYYPMSVYVPASETFLSFPLPRTRSFSELLGDSHQFGVSLSYAVQPSPDGLAGAFIIGEEFIGRHRCHGSGRQHFQDRLKNGSKAAERMRKRKGATVFGHGTTRALEELDKGGKAVSLKKKPKTP